MSEQLKNFEEMEYEDLSAFFTQEQVLQYDAEFQEIYGRFKADIETLLDKIGNRKHAIIRNCDPKGNVDIRLILL